MKLDSIQSYKDILFLLVAAICGDPGDLENGVKDGSLFFFPHTMNYKCFHGYVLVGMSSVECQEGGTWSGPKPSCEGREGIGTFAGNSAMSAKRPPIKERPVTRSTAYCKVVSAICHQSTSGGFSRFVTSELAESHNLSGREFLCTTAMEYNPYVSKGETWQFPSDLTAKFIRFYLFIYIYIYGCWQIQSD